MNTRRNRKARHLSSQVAEMGAATPLVIAERLHQMFGQGRPPGPQEWPEMQRMVTEKLMAFGQGWQAMSLQTLNVWQSQWMAMMTQGNPWLGGKPSPSASRLLARSQHDMLDVLSKGVAPLHKAAVANARRLGPGRAR